MKRTPMTVIAAAILAAATTAYAQKPSFSGTWTVDPGAGSGAGGETGPVKLTVKHTADTLTLEGEGPDGRTQTRTYKLDGTESVNINRMAPGGPQEIRSTAKWDGDKLVITMKAGKAERTQTWSMAGEILTLENTTSSPGAPGPTKWVYKKAS